MEIWKDVKGYEGLYQVSNQGRVKSLPKTWTSGNGTIRSHKGFLLAQHLRVRYNAVVLTKDGKRKNHNVHQLVAIAFLGHEPCGYELVVDHIDNDPLNNFVENLQVITQRKNSVKNRKSKSKYTGVDFIKVKGKFRARITMNGECIHLGLFDCELAAAKAYQDKLKSIS